jgi:hypothetical protein
MELSNQLQAPAILTPQSNLATHWTGGWIGPKVGLDISGGGGNAVYLIYVLVPSKEFLNQLIDFYNTLDSYSSLKFLIFYFK